MLYTRHMNADSPVTFLKPFKRKQLNFIVLFVPNGCSDKHIRSSVFFLSSGNLKLNVFQNQLLSASHTLPQSYSCSSSILQLPVFFHKLFDSPHTLQGSHGLLSAFLRPTLLSVYQGFLPTLPAYLYHQGCEGTLQCGH